MNEIIHGDCLEVMKKFPDNHFSAIVTDPPYGLSFMGKGWDYEVPKMHIWKEALRISKPGAFLLSMGGTRTFHRLTCAIEDAGWEIRDCISWIYGSGFPKSHNHFGIEGYGTALKPAQELITLAMKPLGGTFKQNAEKWGQSGINIDACRISSCKDDSSTFYTCREHESNRRFRILNSILSFFGCEPFEAKNHSSVLGCVQSLCKVLGSQSHCLAYSHLCDELLRFFSIHAQDVFPSQHDVLSYISRFRKEQNDILSSQDIVPPSTLDDLMRVFEKSCNDYPTQILKNKGRWPANVIFDEEAAKMLDEQSGVLKSGKHDGYLEGESCNQIYGKRAARNINPFDANSGGASRFFYCAKASVSERNEGIFPRENEPTRESLSDGGMRRGNNHPTVKPLKLMEYLIKLVAPPSNALILDPFAGSGSTILAAKRLGIDAIGIEKSEEYCKIASARINVALADCN